MKKYEGKEDQKEKKQEKDREEEKVASEEEKKGTSGRRSVFIYTIPLVEGFVPRISNII